MDIELKDMNVVALPGYNCQDTLAKVVNAIPKGFVDALIYVDDCSQDNSLAIAKELNINHVIQHEHNKGYGGNQKTLYKKALDIGADIVILLHPDYQYNPSLIPNILEQFNNGADVVFASRMMRKKEAMDLGMPFYKYYANRLLSKFQNCLFKQNLSEYHTGYRAYTAKVLEDIDFHLLSDDFIFDNQMILEIIKKKFIIKEIYCPAKYAQDSSSINIKRSIVYGFLVLWYSVIYKIR